MPQQEPVADVPDDRRRREGRLRHGQDPLGVALAALALAQDRRVAATGPRDASYRVAGDSPHSEANSPQSAGDSPHSTGGDSPHSPGDSPHFPPELLALAKDGDDLFDHYRHVLEALGQHRGTLGLIFSKAQTSSRTRLSCAAWWWT